MADTPLDDWELPEEIYEHVHDGRSRTKNWLRAQKRSQAKPLALRHRVKLSQAQREVAVTLPKIGSD